MLKKAHDVGAKVIDHGSGRVTINVNGKSIHVSHTGIFVNGRLFLPADGKPVDPPKTFWRKLWEWIW